ncbi:MAG: hypothetical protein M1812_004140 [Candelaria pacifica]|nr:MAG: hypothetical protein M1812_004140 [Candelaria pacifica]
MTSSINQKDIYPFLSHPREIRNMIYTYALNPPSGIVTIRADYAQSRNKHLKQSTHVPTSLFLSNRQISDEACPFLYGSTTLQFVNASPATVVLFLRQAIRPSTLRMIESITMEPRIARLSNSANWSPLIDLLNNGMPSLRTVEVTFWDPGVEPAYKYVAEINKLAKCRMLTPRAYNMFFTPQLFVRTYPLLYQSAAMKGIELNKAIVAQYKVSDVLGEGWTWKYENVDLKGDGTNMLTIGFTKITAACVKLPD